MNKYGLSNYDATILVKEKEISDYYDECISNGADVKLACNWVTSVILGHTNKYDLKISEVFVTPKMLSDVIELVNNGEISSKQAKEVIFKALIEDKNPIEIIEEEGISQIGSSDEILKIVMEVLEENPNAKEQYLNGRTNILDFLVGQVMKKTKGKANPASTRSMMKEKIEKR